MSESPEVIAARIQKLAETKRDPSNYTAIIPTEKFDAVIELLETTDDLGTKHNGISLCYGDNKDWTKIRYYESLATEINGDQCPECGRIMDVESARGFDDRKQRYTEISWQHCPECNLHVDETGEVTEIGSEKIGVDQ